MQATTPNSFADKAAAHVAAVWKALVELRDTYREQMAKRRSRPLRRRAAQGCLFWLLFGIPFVIPVVTWLAYVSVGALLLAYLTLVAVIWGIAALIERCTRRIKPL